MSSQWVPAPGNWVAYLEGGTLVRVASHPQSAWRWDGGPGASCQYVWVQSLKAASCGWSASDSAWLSDLRPSTQEELAKLQLSGLEGL